MSKTGLGKGLSALIPMDPDLLSKDEPVAEIDVALIKTNAYQPRKSFDEEKLAELAESIREHGVVQPVVVRPIGSGKYELVVGERRLRACKSLGISQIPAVIKDFSDREMMELALIENLQRQDLNPVEEATAYKRLMEEFSLTQEQVAQRLSKSRPLIANMVRLLNLPPDILEYVSSGTLTVGHVRPLLSIPSYEIQIKLAQEMVKRDLTVRESESLIKQYSDGKNKKKTKTKAAAAHKSPELADLEEKLRERCGTKVKIREMGEKGRIEIDYYNSDDLERIVSLFLEGPTGM